MLFVREDNMKYHSKKILSLVIRLYVGREVMQMIHCHDKNEKQRLSLQLYQN